MKKVRIWACSECKTIGKVVREVRGGSSGKAQLFYIEARGDHFEKSPDCEGSVTLVDEWLVQDLVEMYMRAFREIHGIQGPS